MTTAAARWKSKPVSKLFTVTLLFMASNLLLSGAVSLDRSSIAWLHGGHLFAPSFVEFDSSGKLFYTASGDGGIKVWDLQARRHLRTFFDPALGRFGDNQLALSPDGRLAAGASFESDTIRIVRLDDGATQTLLTNAPRFISSLSISPDNQHLAVADLTGPLRIWNVAQRRVIDQSFADTAGRHINAFLQAQFVSETDLVAVGANEITRFSLARQTPVWRQTNFVQSARIALSSNFQQLAASDTNRVLILRPTDGQITSAFPLENDGVTALRFSHSNSLLAIGYRSGRVEVRRLPGGQML